MLNKYLINHRGLWWRHTDVFIVLLLEGNDRPAAAGLCLPHSSEIKTYGVDQGQEIKTHLSHLCHVQS